MGVATRPRTQATNQHSTRRAEPPLPLPIDLIGRPPLGSILPTPIRFPCGRLNRHGLEMQSPSTSALLVPLPQPKIEQLQGVWFQRKGDPTCHKASLRLTSHHLIFQLGPALAPDQPARTHTVPLSLILKATRIPSLRISTQASQPSSASIPSPSSSRTSTRPRSPSTPNTTSSPSLTASRSVPSSPTSRSSTLSTISPPHRHSLADL